MRLKYYLRGLGLGILVTCVILMISFHTRKSTMSDEEIIERAKKIGMVMPETESDTQVVEEDVSQQENNTQDVLQQENNTQDAMQQENVPQSVTIQVNQGEVCRQIAEDLMNKGLVADAEDFRKYMDAQNYDSYIRQGIYEIPYGATYQQIAEIITKKNE